jgi:hypothetical protein
MNSTTIAMSAIDQSAVPEPLPPPELERYDDLELEPDSQPHELPPPDEPDERRPNEPPPEERAPPPEKLRALLRPKLPPPPLLPLLLKPPPDRPAFAMGAEYEAMLHIRPATVDAGVPALPR